MIEITDYKEIPKRAENVEPTEQHFDYILTLNIPDTMKNNTALMGKAVKLLPFFNSEKYTLSLVMIDGNVYIQSIKTAKFEIAMSLPDCIDYIIADLAEAQILINNIQIPEALMMVGQVWDGSEWSEK